MKTTDNEITELAWNLFKDVARGITFPETVKMVELKDGTVSFVLYIQSGSGRGMMTLKPNIELVKRAIEVSEKVMSGITEKFKHSEYIIQEGRETFARALIYGFMKTFHFEINDAVSNFFKVPALILKEAVAGELEGLDTGIEKEEGN